MGAHGRYTNSLEPVMEKSRVAMRRSYPEHGIVGPVRCYMHTQLPMRPRRDSGRQHKMGAEHAARVLGFTLHRSRSGSQRLCLCSRKSRSLVRAPPLSPSLAGC